MDNGTFFELPSRPSVRDCILHGPPTLRMFRTLPAAPTRSPVADPAQPVAAERVVIDTETDSGYGHGVTRHESDCGLSGGAGQARVTSDTRPVTESMSVAEWAASLPSYSERYIGASRLPRPQA